MRENPGGECARLRVTAEAARQVALSAAVVGQNRGGGEARAL